MENLGALAILLAFCVAIYAAVASVVGRIKRVRIPERQCVIGRQLSIKPEIALDASLRREHDLPQRKRSQVLIERHGIDKSVFSCSD